MLLVLQFLFHHLIDPIDIRKNHMITASMQRQDFHCIGDDVLGQFVMNFYADSADGVFVIHIFFYDRKHILNQKCVFFAAERSKNNGIAFSVFRDLLLYNRTVFFHL